MARLKAEYGVDATYEAIECETARWVDSTDKKKLADFEKRYQANMAEDAEGHMTYLAPSKWMLTYVQKEWPDIVFKTTRELN